jgi:hypothetical protein
MHAQASLTAPPAVALSQPRRHDPAMCGQLAYARKAHDAYWTEPWVTETLLDRVSFRGRVWEPAVGVGAMAQVLMARGYPLVASDLIDHGFPPTEQADFLQHLGLLGDQPYSIVTNPPYHVAEAFIRHALRLTQPVGGMVAMLLRSEYRHAKSRIDLFEGPPFRAEIALTRRPRWIAGTTGSPRHNYSWYIWDWRHDSLPVMLFGPDGRLCPLPPAQP